MTVLILHIFCYGNLLECRPTQLLVMQIVLAGEFSAPNYLGEYLISYVKYFQMLMLLSGITALHTTWKNFAAAWCHAEYYISLLQSMTSWT